MSVQITVNSVQENYDNNFQIKEQLIELYLDVKIRSTEEVSFIKLRLMNMIQAYKIMRKKS